VLEVRSAKDIEENLEKKDLLLKVELVLWGFTTILQHKISTRVYAIGTCELQHP
jgi:hypothetical protein